MNRIDPPEGHISILFTDMESSSATSRILGAETYREKLREPHNQLIREALSRHNGFEVGTPAGDSFMIVFHESEQAIRCAVTIQTMLHEKPIAVQGSDGRTYTCRVRLGVHTAEEPLRLSDSYEYVGADVALASRVESLGVGGQILVSSSAYRSCPSARTFAWKRWPNRRLKGFDRLETVWELLWDGRSRGEPGGSGRDVHQHAAEYEAAGRWREAEQAYLQSLELMRDYGDRSGECRTLNNLGAVRLRQGLVQEAEAALSEGLDLARELGDQGTEARVLLNLGLAHQQQGGFQEAERHYRRSLRLREQSGDRAGVARCLRYLGGLQEAAGDAAGAEASFRASLEAAEEAADRRAQAATLMTLGRLEYFRGALEAAEAHHRKAQELFVALEDRVGEGRVLSNLAVLSQQRSQGSRAERQHRTALTLLREAGQESQVLRARVNYGAFLQSSGETGAARTILEECYDAARASRDEAATGVILANVALMMDQGGDWSGAVNVARRAAQVLERAGQRELQATVEGWLRDWTSAAPAGRPSEPEAERLPI